MSMRLYWATIKKWAESNALKATTFSVLGFAFLYLQMIGAIEITGASGDSVCAGTVEDPCFAYVNFTVKNTSVGQDDIFLYQIGYDPYGRDTFLEFDNSVKDWKLQRSWGSGWRDIPLDRGCTGSWCGCSWCRKDNPSKFSYAFREGRDYALRVVAYKNNVSDNIKWSMLDGGVDPYFFTPLEKNVKFEKVIESCGADEPVGCEPVVEEWYRVEGKGFVVETPVNTPCFWYADENGKPYDYKNCSQPVIVTSLYDKPVDKRAIQLITSFETDLKQNEKKAVSLLEKGKEQVFMIDFEYPLGKGEEWNISAFFNGIELFIDPTISACGTLSSDGATYTLDSDITGSTTSSCFAMTCKNCVLDCDGHTVDGNDVADFAVDVLRAVAEDTNVTVKNCVFTDWDTAAIRNSRAYYNRFENITVSSVPDYDMQALYSTGVNMTNWTSTSNKGGYYNSVKEFTLRNYTAVYSQDGMSWYLPNQANCNNIFINVTIFDKPALMFNGAVNIANYNNNVSQIILCGGSNYNVTNSSFVNDYPGANLDGYAIVLNGDITQSHFSNLNFSNHWYDIFTYNANNCDFANITTSRASQGIYLYYANHMNITNWSFTTVANNIAWLTTGAYYNRITNCYLNGASWSGSRCVGLINNPHDNYFTNNTCVNVDYAYSLHTHPTNAWTPTGNVIINNNISYNEALMRNPYEFTGGISMGINFFNNSVEGNHYYIYGGGGYSENCSDSDYDGFCDLALNITTAVGGEGFKEDTSNFVNGDFKVYSDELDSYPPKISFDLNTPENDSNSRFDSVVVNVSVDDEYDASAFVDWNRSLVGWWSFDYYNSTQVFDNSSWGNNGTFEGGLSTDNITSAGARGKALEFDDVDGNLDCGDNFDLTDDLTISAWVKIEKSETRYLLSKLAYGNDGFSFTIHSSGSAYFFLFNNTAIRAGNLSSSTVDDGAWHYVATTYNGSRLAYYVDGEFDKEYNWNSYLDIGKTTNNCFISSQWAPFNGTLDEVMAWNRVLSPEEINASFNAGIYRLNNTFADLPDGDYSYYATAIDEAGKVNKTEVRTITIDAVAPFYVRKCGDVMDVDNATFYLRSEINGTDNPFVDSTDTWNRVQATMTTKWEIEGQACLYFDAVANATLDCEGQRIMGMAYAGTTYQDFGVGFDGNSTGNLSVINCNIHNWTAGIGGGDAPYFLMNLSNLSNNGPGKDGVTERPGFGAIVLNASPVWADNIIANYITEGEDETYAASCPFGYVCNGTDFVLANEDLSPFHAPWLEDYYTMRLTGIAPCPDDFKFRIVEQLPETTYYNYLSILKVEHAKGTEVYKDTDGNTYSISELKVPLSCEDQFGKSCLDVISEEDGEFWNWQYDRRRGFNDFKAEATLTFRKEGDFAKLLWKPQLNALPMDKMYVDVLDYVGSANYNVFEELVSEGKPFEGHTDAINTLYLWDGKGWERLHIGIESMAVNHAGKWVVPVNLTGIPGETFKIKIVTLPLSGGPDFVQVDFSEDKVVSERLIVPDISCSNGFGSKEFESDDEIYAVLHNGDYCNVSFSKPTELVDIGSKLVDIGGKLVGGEIGKIGEIPQNSVTYFTKSKGYYVPDFTKEVRENKKNFITKQIHEWTIKAFWTHDNLRENGAAGVFPETYVTYLKSDVAKMPEVPLTHSVETGWDLGYHSSYGLLLGVGNNLIVRNLSCVGTTEMDVCVAMGFASENIGAYGGPVEGLTGGNVVYDSYMEGVKAPILVYYHNMSGIFNNVMNNTNDSCVLVYSSSHCLIYDNSCLNTSQGICDVANFDFGDANIFNAISGAFVILATQSDSLNNSFFNNTVNVSTRGVCQGDFDQGPKVDLLFFNASIGNVWANLSGGWSPYTYCNDSNYDGVCDDPFDPVENTLGNCTFGSDFCDYRAVRYENNTCYDNGEGFNWSIDACDHCNFKDDIFVWPGNITVYNSTSCHRNSATCASNISSWNTIYEAFINATPDCRWNSTQPSI